MEIYFRGVEGAVVALVLLWLVTARWNRPAIVDVAWTMATTVLIVYFFFSSPLQGPAQYLILLGGLFWGVKLSYLLIDRMLKGQTDGRYTTLKEKWGNQRSAAFLFFFIFQGVGAGLLTFPVFVAMVLRENLWATTDLFAVILLIGALTGEALVDFQLRKFRLNPENKGKVCEEGLWRYSRHPNYFFEWCLWVSYALFAFPVPLWGWVSFASPLLLLILVLRVTGIPPTEEQALKSRPEAYKDYQRRVSAFVPWFPKA